LAQSSDHDQGSPLIARRFQSGPANERGEFLASWVLMSSRADLFTRPEFARSGQPLAIRQDVRLWTDEYSSLLPILRWTGRH
jgi:hypothetical protein